MNKEKSYTLYTKWINLNGQNRWEKDATFLDAKDMSRLELIAHWTKALNIPKQNIKIVIHNK